MKNEIEIENKTKHAFIESFKHFQHQPPNQKRQTIFQTKNRGEIEIEIEIENEIEIEIEIGPSRLGEANSGSIAIELLRLKRIKDGVLSDTGSMKTRISRRVTHAKGNQSSAIVLIDVLNKETENAFDGDS